MEIAILIVCLFNLLFILAIAGTLAKLIRYIAEKENEPVVGSKTENREQRGLQQLQDERDDRWGLHMSYDLPNYDGVANRPKNFDGVGEALIDRDQEE